MSTITPAGESPTRATVRGDWNDAEAAAIVAAGQNELAILMVAPQGDAMLVVDMTTVGDDPVRLTARRADPDTIELEARVGRFGDPVRERALLQSVAKRLRDLSGRDWAPVRR